VEVWVERGTQTAMNQFNADPRAVEKQKAKKKPKTDTESVSDEEQTEQS